MNVHPLTLLHSYAATVWQRSIPTLTAFRLLSKVITRDQSFKLGESIWSYNLTLLALICCLIISVVSTSDAQEDIFEEGNRHVQVELVADRINLQLPQDISTPVAQLGLKFTVADNWHIYWENPGEAAVATAVEWTLPSGWKVGSLQWPTPLKFIERGDIVTFGYERETFLTAPLYAAAEIPQTSQKLIVRAKVSWLVCNDICVPGERELQIPLNLGLTEPTTPSQEQQTFGKYRTHYPLDKLAADLTVTNAKTAPGGKGFVTIKLPSLKGKSAAEIASAVQIFPRSAEPLLVSSRGFLVAEDTTPAVAFGVDVPNNLTAGAYDISGVISLKQNGTETAYNFRSSVEVSRNAAPVEILSGTPLRWREISHEDTLAIPPAPQPWSFTELTFVILAAFVAGLILNLMPCVLPIIAIKVMSFIEHAEQSRVEIVKNSLSFAAGVVSSFIALAIVVIALRNVGLQVGWGFQFQYPGFVFVLIIVIYLLSLAFFDIYEVNLPGMRRINRAANVTQTLSLRHFFDGVLATALSTPCTAPFLGTALAFAFTQSSGFTVLIFSMIGVGLASPYVILATNPALIKRLPQPGPWMSRFRQLMGFFLLATVIWLIFVMQSLNPATIIPVLIVLVSIQFLFWLYETLEESSLFNSRQGLLKAIIVPLFLLLGIVGWLKVNEKTDPAPSAWQSFSPQLVDQELSAGRKVFIDFTAAWCITCKFNERFVLDTEAVLSEFAKRNVVLFKADWTKKDQIITEALTKYGGRGVPHYVILEKDAVPKTLPSLLTTDLVLGAIKEGRSETP